MRRVIGIAFLTLALLQFAYRGTERVRTEIPLWDFDSVYAAARTWVHGGNPYDLPAVMQTWHDTGLFSNRDASYFATVYPPNSLCLLIPFAVLPALPANLLWLALSLALLALQFTALADLAGLHRRDPRVLILVAAALASAPFQFGLLSGQLTVPAVSLCILGFWCAVREHEAFAGILLGLAAALKPQIAAPFIAYYLLLRRWSVSGLAIFVGGAIVVIALLAMRASHIEWLAGWKQSIALTTRFGAVNDYGWVNDLRDEIMDLKILLITPFHDTHTLHLAVESIVLVLCLWYLKIFPWKPGTDRQELLTIAGLSALSFLPVYHRVYDAALLTTALAWALAELDGPRRRYAIAILIPMALFLVPFDITRTLARRLPILDRLWHTPWWQSLISPNYAWALLAITLAILITMTRAFRECSQPRHRFGGASKSRLETRQKSRLVTGA